MVLNAEIRPAGAGAATIEVVLERMVFDDENYPPGYSWLRLARANATAAAGFVFDHWETETVGVLRGEPGWPSNGNVYVVAEQNSRDNPTSVSVRYETAFIKDFGWRNSVLVWDLDGVGRKYLVDATCTKIVAVFAPVEPPEPPAPPEKGLIYEPGDGRLIYDIATGRPMCYD